MFCHKYWRVFFHFSFPGVEKNFHLGLCASDVFCLHPQDILFLTHYVLRRLTRQYLCAPRLIVVLGLRCAQTTTFHCTSIIHPLPQIQSSKSVILRFQMKRQFGLTSTPWRHSHLVPGQCSPYTD